MVSLHCPAFSDRLLASSAGLLYSPSSKPAAQHFLLSLYLWLLFPDPDLPAFPLYWAHLDNPVPPPCIKFLNLTMSAKTLFPCKVTYSQVPGILTWTSLGGSLFIYHSHATSSEKLLWFLPATHNKYPDDKCTGVFSPSWSSQISDFLGPKFTLYFFMNAPKVSSIQETPTELLNSAVTSSLPGHWLRSGRHLGTTSGIPVPDSNVPKLGLGERLRRNKCML